MEIFSIDDAIEFCENQKVNYKEFKSIVGFLKKYKYLRYKETPVGVHKHPMNGNYYICNNCGALINKGDAYCHSCGHLLTVGVKL